jgi:hypothetical protein
MKSFINKYAEKVGSAGTLIPLIYWFSVWFDFSKINIFFIFLLLFSTFFWVLAMKKKDFF